VIGVSVIDAVRVSVWCLSGAAIDAVAVDVVIVVVGMLLVLLLFWLPLILVSMYVVVVLLFAVLLLLYVVVVGVDVSAVVRIGANAVIVYAVGVEGGVGYVTDCICVYGVVSAAIAVVAGCAVGCVDVVVVGVL